MNADRRQVGSGQCLVVHDARLLKPARCRCDAAEHPFIAARQAGQQRGDIGRQRDRALAFHLVLDGQGLPLEVYVFPPDTGHFLTARASQ